MSNSVPFIQLNSHSLSYYQNCPREYYLKVKRSLRPAKTRSVFKRGTLVTRWLALYYFVKRHPTKVNATKLLFNAEFWMNKFMRVMEIPEDEALHYFRILCTCLLYTSDAADD